MGGEVEDRLRERNQRNACRSTGPRSARGKAASRLNALKFGVTSRQLLLPGEDPSELRRLDLEIRRALNPVGAAEEIIVDRLVLAEVRRRRIDAAERSILFVETAQRALERAQRDPVRTAVERGGIRILLGEAAATEAEQRLPAYGKALRDEEQMSALRDGKESDLGVTYASAMDMLDRLARHRTAVERSIDRALHELTRLQDRREGRDTRPPAALDVTVATDVGDP